MTREKLIEEARKGIDDGEYDTFNDPDQAMADFALKHFGIYREICEAAQRMKFADHISLYPFEGGYAVVKTREGVGGIQHFDTLPEAYQFVKGGRR